MSGAVQAAIVRCAPHISHVLSTHEGTLRSLSRVLHLSFSFPANDSLISAYAWSWRGAASTGNGLRAQRACAIGVTEIVLAFENEA